MGRVLTPIDLAPDVPARNGTPDSALFFFDAIQVSIASQEQRPVRHRGRGFERAAELIARQEIGFSSRRRNGGLPVTTAEVDPTTDLDR